MHSFTLETLQLHLNLAGMELKEEWAIATILDGKYKKYFFRDPDAYERAKSTLIEKLVQAMREDTNTEVKYWVTQFESPNIAGKILVAGNAGRVQF